MKRLSKSITFYAYFDTDWFLLHLLTYILTPPPPPRPRVTWHKIPSFIPILISVYAFNSYIKPIRFNRVHHESKWCTLVSRVICLKELFSRHHFLRDSFWRKAEQWTGSSYLRDWLDLRVFKNGKLWLREKGCQEKGYIYCQSLYILL